MDRSQLIKTFNELYESLALLLGDEDFLQRVEAENPWFTRKNVELAIGSILPWLEADCLEKFSSKYDFQEEVKRVGLVLAGNIPLVGFHDVMCTLLSGNVAVVKLSGKDEVLMGEVLNILVGLNPKIASRLERVDRLKNIEAFIGTGSDNTNRYFDHYFGKYPHIFRQNRTSVAVLDQQTTHEDLLKLGADLFSYFGLGCRNVSTLLVSREFDLLSLFDAFRPYEYLKDHNKFYQNYSYRKAVYLTSGMKFLDGEFFILRESDHVYSNIAEVLYMEYDNAERVHQFMKLNKEKIQTVVANPNSPWAVSDFGSAQYPSIDDFADGVDTMAFLSTL